MHTFTHTHTRTHSHTCTHSLTRTHAHTHAHLLVLFGHGLEGSGLLALKHAGTGSLLNHGQNLWGFHVEDFCDATLHDEEVRVVDVELHRLEEVGHPGLLGVVAVDHVLVLPANGNLHSNSHTRCILRRAQTHTRERRGGQKKRDQVGV